jgi:hypothetical protein
MANPTKIQLQQKVRDLKEEIVKLETELEALKKSIGHAGKKQYATSETQSISMQLHGGTIPELLK